MTSKMDGGYHDRMNKLLNGVAIFFIVLSLVVFAAALLKGQEPEPKQTNAEINEIEIPELNLLRIQNLNFRFQLLVTQRTQIEQELREIQVEVFAELENVRKSLNANSDTWNVDLVKGVFVRKPKPEERKSQ